MFDLGWFSGPETTQAESNLVTALPTVTLAEKGLLASEEYLRFSLLVVSI